jgi:hypothetical protein
MLGCQLDSLDVLSLPALRAFGHIELHGLPFLQAAKASCMNSGEMHEDILASLAADKAVPLASLNHFTVPCSMDIPISVL